jgi:glycosyltransferase involved in cell wall biosynthesis
VGSRRPGGGQRNTREVVNTEWIAYVGPFRFPWGQPGSRRVYGNARALAAAGHRVIVCSGENGPPVPELIEAGESDQVWHAGLGELHRGDASVATKALNLLVAQGAKTVRWLEGQAVKPSHVIAYGGYAAFMGRLIPWCRRNRIPIVADVVEWYEAAHLPGGRFGPFALSTEIAMRWQYPQCDGVIAISTFLENYYLKRGSRVIRVPPTLDVGNRSAPRAASSCDRLNLVYAGTPGRKDLLVNILRGINAVDPAGRSVSLRVLGISHEQVRRLMQPGEAVAAGVSVIGRVPQPDVAREYESADFSVLLRPPLRYATAGFPTKLVESCAAGVPAILNATSDIGGYVRDGVEALHCADHTPEAFAVAVRRALGLTPAERSAMGVAARSAAERCFDFRNYSGELSSFLAHLGA